MKNIKLLFSIISVIAITGAISCIHNDIPYPRIQANFQSFNVEGQVGGSVIDSVNCTINVTLAEDVDPYAVKVIGYSVTPGSEVLDNPFDEPLNLSEPKYVTVRLYQDYTWIIYASQ